MSDTLLVDQSEGVLTVTLNRPEVLNAFNEQMLRELHEALRQAERDAAVRGVALTGAGGGLCPGSGPHEPGRGAGPSLPGVLRQPHKPNIAGRPVDVETPTCR